MRELNRRQRAEPCAAVLDRDRRGEQQLRRRRRAPCSGVENRGPLGGERRVDDVDVVGEQTQERDLVEAAPDPRRRDDRVRPVQGHGRTHGRLSRASDLRQHVGGSLCACDHRLHLDVVRHEQRDRRPCGERTRRRRLTVDRDEPAARDVVGVPAGADRHGQLRPPRERPVDLRPRLPADVDPEHAHPRLGRPAILERTRDSGADRGQRDHGKQDESGALHPDSEAVTSAGRRDGPFAALSHSRIVLNVELRDLPSVDELTRRSDDPLAVEAARSVLARAREEIRAGVDPGDLPQRLVDELASARRPALRRVLNATGVIVHTNLGRAPLPAAAIERAVDVGRGYSNLEYDLAEGARGSRQDHVAALLRRLTGAEAAIVVNNNAAAMLLALAALAEGREVLVSRGELIEIGDGFRIPDVLARSGAQLVEVGTTNRTRAADYDRAATADAALLLRVHQSNFRVVGFAERPSLKELAAVARARGLPLLDDLGSGVFVDVGDEPTARGSLADGADLVCFSGDKLLGGPRPGSSSVAPTSSTACGAIPCTAPCGSTSSASPRSKGRSSSTSTPHRRGGRCRCSAC